MPFRVDRAFADPGNLPPNVTLRYYCKHLRTEVTTGMVTRMLPALLCIFVSSDIAQTAAGFGGALVVPIFDEPLSEGRTTSLAATAAQKRLITILDEPSGRIFTPLLALSCLLTVCSVYFRAESHLDPAEAEKLVRMPSLVILCSSIRMNSPSVNRRAHARRSIRAKLARFLSLCRDR